MYGHIFKWNYKKKDEFVQKICQRLWDFQQYTFYVPDSPILV